jgi:DUF971 family protein
MRVEPTEIIHESDRELTIRWSDGGSTGYTAPQLRRSCPCAGCINEWTGEKMLDDRKIPDDLTFAPPELVGRYALTFRFSDGHDSGIYSFDYLHKLN